MTTRTFEVVLYQEPESGDWVTLVPALGGTPHRAASRGDALADVRKTLERYVEACAREGREVTEAATTEVFAVHVEERPRSDGSEELDEDGYTPEQAAALRRMQEHFAHIPADVDLAAEIISERREEARREEERERAWRNEAS